MRIVILFILLVSNCTNRKEITYEEGLKTCRSNFDRAKKFGSNTNIAIGPDCLIGAKIPDFEAKLIDGSSYSSEDLKGKISVINFWFIDCPPCVAEISGLNYLVERFGIQYVNYVAIGRDKRSDINAFLKNHVWNYSHISGETSLNDTIFMHYWGYPTTYILNRRTEIIYATSGGRSDSTASKELLNKLIPILKNAVENDDL